MDKKILRLAKKLIEIPSTSENPKKLSEILELAISELSGFEYLSFTSNQIPSLLFGNRGKNLLDYKIILNAHLDVVDGKSEQFVPFEKDGKLLGRGAYDMKAAAAVLILLFKEIANKVDYPLGLQLTTDEESWGTNGTVYQINRGIRADFVIAGEGTNFKVVNESKAIMTLKLNAKGKTSHSAYPWLGDNAIWKMQGAIQKLYESFPIPKSEWEGTTVNVTSIRTDNRIFNKTPDSCEAIVDARVIPKETATFLNNIHKILGDEIEVKIISDTQAHKTDPNILQIKKLRHAIKNIFGYETGLERAHGVSDIRHYTSVGCEGIEFGPIGGNHHSNDEWVDIQSLTDYYSILKNFLIA